LTLIDPSDQGSPTDAPEAVVESQSNTASSAAAEVSTAAEPSEGRSTAASDAASLRRRILIGSQRDPAAYRARPRHDVAPIDESAKKAKNRRRGRRKAENGSRKIDGGRPSGQSGNEPAVPSSVLSASTVVEPPVGPALGFAVDAVAEPPVVAPGELPHPQDDVAASSFAAGPAPVIPSASLVAHRMKEEEARDLEDELHRAMGGSSMDELLGGSQAEQEVFEPESLLSGCVVAVRRDDVFVELAGCQQGIVPLRQFDVPPRPGATIQVVVQRINPEDGLYELSVPNKAVQVDDWSDLIEGALIEVRVTGHNTGGLECEVNHIRGFIPISQVSLYRVEDLAPLVDQRLTCVITEADPERRNLVLSRRAVLEREREQARQQMLYSLRPGQIHEGVVRKLMDFGAFVDLGGVDGLLHVSQLAWSRVKHPSDVLHEGQTVKVRVDKVDPTTGRISLAYRDLLENPWTAAAQKYPRNNVVQGTVTKLMEFGAFVEVEPGIEGLVHISELSHKRVWRPADVVKEGDKVEVMVLSVDPSAQRMSLSMKAMAAPPEPAKKEDDSSAPAKSSKKSKPTGPLLGGLGRTTGDRFGLKW
jgi:predicted RNA-binding protein with RPS1 domain